MTDFKLITSSIPRLINAGCGEVLTAKVPYSGNTGATHLLTEARYMTGNQLDLGSLATNNISWKMMTPFRPESDRDENVFSRWGTSVSQWPSIW